MGNSKIQSTGKLIVDLSHPDFIQSEFSTLQYIHVPDVNL